MNAKATGAMAVVLWFAGVAFGDFNLTGIEHLDVTTSHTGGFDTLRDASTADVLAGGSISASFVYTHDASGFAVSGGSLVGCSLLAYGTSTLGVTGGSISGSTLDAYDTANIEITGGMGNGYGVGTHNASCAVISGGPVSYISARDVSSFTLHGYDFQAGGAFSEDDPLRLVPFAVVDGTPLYQVFGMGYLFGKWADGSGWTIAVLANDPGATILALPEPATLAMLALGGLPMLRRRGRVGR